MSMQAWARILGATAEQADRVFDELRAEQAFDFNGDNSAMQITSRYMVRETCEMEGNNKRQKDYREKNNGKCDAESNGDCNGKNNTEITPQKEEGRFNNSLPTGRAYSEFTLEEVLEAAKDPSVAVSEEEAEACYKHYKGEWTYGTGKPVENIQTCLRRWKRRQGEFNRTKGTQNNGTRQQAFTNPKPGRGSLNNPDDYNDD